MGVDAATRRSLISRRSSGVEPRQVDGGGLELGAAAEVELDRGSLGGDVGSGTGLGWRRGVEDCWAATASRSGAGVR